MKPEIQEMTKGIRNLSLDAVRRLDGNFALSKDAQKRIYQQTLRRTGVREKADRAASFAAARGKSRRIVCISRAVMV